MFKFRKIFLIALLAGTLGVIGCGDDPAPSNGNGNGNGGTPSNGSVCDQCENQDEKPECEVCYTECDNPDEGACELVALLCCEIV
jgi:hypothetical protein